MACGAEIKNVGHVMVGDKLYCHSCAPSNNNINNNNKMPQGLAANLARITDGHQQSGAQGLTANLARIREGQAQAGPGAPPGSPPPPSDWAKRLDHNTAGMALNAEDFTKEFMKQLTGGQ